MSASINQLIPELRPFARDLLAAAGAAGLQPRITSTRRSYAEQSRLYRRYLAGASAYPAAPPGHSAHEYGYAFDMIVSPLSELADVGDYWEKQGGVWGGRIGDNIHFEYPGFQQDMGSSINVAQQLDDQTAQQNPIVRAAQAISDLPWWASVFVPIAATTRTTSDDDPMAQFVKRHPLPSWLNW